MKIVKYILFSLLMAVVTPFEMQAKHVKMPKMYMFGFSASFQDSIIYMTDVQEIEGVWYDTKTKFLLGREHYSYQLKEYLATNEQKPYHDMYAVWVGEFYVYHSGIEGGAVEKVTIDFKGGYDLFAEENYLGEEDASLDERKSGDYFLKVTGDSMKGDGIMDGSLVLVKQTNTVENGKIAVVMVGDEVTVKRVYVKDKVMILEASNPEVENRYFSGTEVRTLPVRVIGRVVLCRTYF